MTYRTTWKSAYRTKSKYGNKSTIYNGRKYDSIREATHAEELDWRMKAGEVIEVIPQFRVGIYIGGSLWRTWKIDFKVVLKDGSYELQEIKGFSTRDYEMKRDALIKIMDGDCECNYITDYQTGKKLEKTELLVIR